MAMEFKKFPEQCTVNLNFLKELNDPYKSGVELFENEYRDLKN
jgi:hypothetical protein